MAASLAAVVSLLVASPGWGDEDENDDRDHGGKGYFAIGWSALDLDPLNDALVASGYPRFSEDFLSLGGGGYGVIGHFVIGGQGHAYLGEGRDATLGAQNYRSDLVAGMGFLDLGWVLWSGGRGRLTPLVGLGGGGLSVEIEELAAPTFGQVLAQPGHRSDLSTGGFLLDLGADFDVLLGRHFEEHHGGFLLGVRAGWILAPIHGGWQLEGRDIAGGPDIGMTGPYVRILLGGGGR
jgi:hypothetical protein